jgi:RES domain
MQSTVLPAFDRAARAGEASGTRDTCPRNLTLSWHKLGSCPQAQQSTSEVPDLLDSRGHDQRARHRRHRSHQDACLKATMLVYRVFPHLPHARYAEPGHPLHLHAQGTGRLDNPGQYRIWYLALEPAGAMAEVFGDRGTWDAAMFEYKPTAGGRYALATFFLADDTPLLDLDDPRNLLARGLRPTQVIERNRAATQNWALNVFNERNDRGSRIWQGVRWWSYHRPQWRIIGYWGDNSPNVLNIEQLSLTSPPAIDALASLRGHINLSDQADRTVARLMSVND